MTIHQLNHRKLHVATIKFYSALETNTWLEKTAVTIYTKMRTVLEMDLEYNGDILIQWHGGEIY